MTSPEANADRPRSGEDAERLRAPHRSDSPDGDATRFVDAGALERSLDAKPSAPIVADGVSKRFGSLTAVSDVSLSISRGEFHALVGPNGSGKTTLGRLVVGLTRPDEGSVTGPTDAVGYGFQRPRYYPNLSARENVATFSRARSDADPADGWMTGVMRALELDGVADRPVGDLSGGFEKKVDLALALLGRPPYLWLDEPLSDLDDLAASRVVSLLSAYVDAGGAVVVSTHAPETFAAGLTHLSAFRDGVLERTTAVSADSLDAVLPTADASFRG